MKTTLFSWLLVFLWTCVTSSKNCARPFSEGEDRRVNKSQLRIGTFNTEWLFLYSSRMECPGNDCTWKTEQAARNHLAQVAKVIQALDVDILQLNEVEDCRVLEQLVALVNDAIGKEKGLYKGYLLEGTDQITHQNAALLTRIDPITALTRSSEKIDFPVQSSTCPSPKSGTKTSSKHFVTTFKIDGYPNPVDVIGLHFIAFPDNKSRCPEREAQATVIANLVSKATRAKHDVVVLGDFNDFDIEISDIANNKPISNTVTIVRDAGNLENAASKLSKSERYSSWYDRNRDCKFNPEKEGSLIDHILLSPALAEELVSTEQGQIEKESCRDDNSDHLPLVVTFKTKSSDPGSSASAITLSTVLALSFGILLLFSMA